MNPHQSLTPKYWIGHRKSSDDVFIDTASKSREVTFSKMERLLWSEWFLDEDLEIILIEIKEVKLK